MNKKLIRKMLTASGGPIFPWLLNTEWVNDWKFRTTPASRSKVLSGKGVETDKQYTERRKKETTKRTWRSDAADIAHGIGEGVLALNPYTAIPYFGAKVGLDFLNGTYGWHTALNASVPLFHLAPAPASVSTVVNRRYRPLYLKQGATPQITAENAASITSEQWTAAQDAAVARGDMAEAQRLRDLHFKINTPGNVVVKQGTPAHNYHGTDREFNTFDIGFFGRTDYGDRGKGFYFSENRNVSENYGPIVKDVYLYAKTPYKGFGKEKYLGRGRSKDEVVQYLTEQHRKRLEDTIKHMINQQKSGSHSPKYDKLGITKDMSEQEIRNLVNKAYNHEDVIPYEVGNLDEADVFLSPYENVVFKPNQIKSANAVTYDNNGVRIPLGERDNFNINDTRYGLLPFGIGLTGYGLYKKKQGGKMNILEFLKNGSGIHIKEKNKGKFTKSAKAAGLTVQEHARSVLNDPNATPLLKKRANFARNAAKWKHKEGGKAFVSGVSILDSNPSAYKEVKKRLKKHLFGGNIIFPNNNANDYSNLNAFGGVFRDVMLGRLRDYELQQYKKKLKEQQLIIDALLELLKSDTISNLLGTAVNKGLDLGMNYLSNKFGNKALDKNGTPSTIQPKLTTNTWKPSTSLFTPSLGIGTQGSIPDFSYMLNPSYKV